MQNVTLLLIVEVLSEMLFSRDFSDTGVYREPGDLFRVITFLDLNWNKTEI